MSSITVHNIDKKLDSKIRSFTKKNNQSLNKTIKLVLMESFGISLNNQKNHRSDFLDCFGIWDKKDAESFEKNISDLNKINPNDWK